MAFASGVGLHSTYVLIRVVTRSECKKTISRPEEDSHFKPVASFSCTGGNSRRPGSSSSSSFLPAPWRLSKVEGDDSEFVKAFLRKKMTPSQLDETLSQLTIRVVPT